MDRSPSPRTRTRAKRELWLVYFFFDARLARPRACLPSSHPSIPLPRASLLAETPAAPPPASLLSLLPSNNPHTTMREVISVHIGQAGECVGLERGAGRGARTPIVFVLSEGGGERRARHSAPPFFSPPPPPPPQPPFPALCPPALRPVGRSRSWTGRAGGWRPVRVGTQPLGGDRFGRRRRGGGGEGKRKRKRAPRRLTRGPRPPALRCLGRQIDRTKGGLETLLGLEWGIQGCLAGVAPTREGHEREGGARRRRRAPMPSPSFTHAPSLPPLALSLSFSLTGIQVGNSCWELYCLEHG